jgi:hypothetical protein
MATRDSEERPVSLSLTRTRRFFDQLASDPFVAIVVADDGEVQIFSKGIEPDHLERIKKVLTDLREGDEDGEEG